MKKKGKEKKKKMKEEILIERIITLASLMSLDVTDNLSTPLLISKEKGNQLDTILPNSS
jgi:hypothetical protein